VLYQRRLFRQDYVSLFRQGHPQGESVVTLEQFGALRHLVVTLMERPYDCINRALVQAGIDPGTTFSVPHFAAVPYIVSTTDLAMVPQKLAERAAGPFQLSYLKSPLPLPVLQTNMFWHRRYNQDEGNRWLRTLLAEMFGK
jgi:DNA-binding transcriptional LysR family regulator